MGRNLVNKIEYLCRKACKSDETTILRNFETSIVLTKLINDTIAQRHLTFYSLPCLIPNDLNPRGGSPQGSGTRNFSDPVRGPRTVLPMRKVDIRFNTIPVVTSLSVIAPANRKPNPNHTPPRLLDFDFLLLNYIVMSIDISALIVITVVIISVS